MVQQNAVAFSWETNNAAAFWSSKALGSLGHRPPHGAHDDACCGPLATEKRLQFWNGRQIPCAQVHGKDVVVVDAATKVPTVGGDSPQGDALVTRQANIGLAIATADCGPVALFSDPVVGAAHAGWKGLVGGVLGATANAMRELGAQDISAVIGPCICPNCYEFDDLQVLNAFERRWGASVRRSTNTGAPSFDLRAAIASECAELDISVLNGDRLDEVPCTACSEGFFSYRARAEKGRQSMIVWRKEHA